MKRVLVAFILLVCCSAPSLSPIASIAAPGQDLPEDATPAKVVGFNDGDKFSVSISGSVYEINTIGADAPELDRGEFGECYATESSRYVSWLLNIGDTVYLESDQRLEDGKGRLLRYVWVQDKATGKTYMLNETMIALGYASFKSKDNNTKYDAVLSAAESSAKSKRLGLWGKCGGPHEKVEPTPTPSPPMGTSDHYASGGLGMSLIDWEKIHGPSEDVYGGLRSYENEKFSIICEGPNVRIIGSGIQHPYRMSLNEARAVVGSLIPNDSVFVKSVTILDGGIRYDYYTSKSLVDRFPATKEIGNSTYPYWDDTPPGGFTVTYGVDVRHGGFITDFEIATGFIS